MKCRQCPDPAVAGRMRCKTHLEEMAEYQREWVRRNRAARYLKGLTA